MGRARTPRQRMCHSKRPLSRRAAHRAAQRYGLRSYHCPICAQYHLTKAEKPQGD